MEDEFLRFTLNRPHVGDMICTECEEVIVNDMGSMTLATLIQYAANHCNERHVN